MITRKLISHLNLFRCISYTVCTKNVEKEVIKGNLKSLVDDSASFEEKDPPTDQWLSSPYPGNKRKSMNIIPGVDPRTTSVLLFPGQGSQFVGMAKSLIDYPNVIQMFDCASEILRYNLLDLCIHGPKDMLDMTVHSQVAVVVSSLAAVEKLRAEHIEMVENCVATAGFSVGEYAALVFAGALEFESAVKLLKVRGEAMQAASDLQASGMITTFLTTQANINTACKCARDWCETQGIENAECKVAIHLYPHCKVVAGHMEALNFLELNGANYGIKKIKYIPVSGAFHTSLMLPAKNVLQRALKTTTINTPQIPVHANIDTKAYYTSEKIKLQLSNQLVKPVKWEQTMHVVFEREKGKEFPNTFSCGPGTSLSSILRLNNNEAYKKCINILA